MDRKELYRNVLIEFNPWTTDRVEGFKPTWQNNCLLLTVKYQRWVRNYFLLTYSNPLTLYLDSQPTESPLPDESSVLGLVS